MAGFAVYGSTGFVGRHVVRHLRRRGHDVEAFGRNIQSQSDSERRHAIYCVGMTAGFRSDPNGTAQAHVSVLADLLSRRQFASLLYLSSTRVYSGAHRATEDAEFCVSPLVTDQLYNLTKLTGESICLANQGTFCRIARLSNVVGPGSATVNFLPSLIEEVRQSGSVMLNTSAQSEKDYVSINDVVISLERIALSGKERIYNVASGQNTSNAEVSAVLTRHMGAHVTYTPSAPTISYPRIDVGRLAAEFEWNPMRFEAAFECSLRPEEWNEAP